MQFHLYRNLEMNKIIEMENRLLVVRNQDGGRQHERSWDDKCILALINVSILVVMLFQSFIKCHHWGNWISGSQVPSLLFLTTAYESTIQLKMKSLIRKNNKSRELPAKTKTAPRAWSSFPQTCRKNLCGLKLCYLLVSCLEGGGLKRKEK